LAAGKVECSAVRMAALKETYVVVETVALKVICSVVTKVDEMGKSPAEVKDFG